MFPSGGNYINVICYGFQSVCISGVCRKFDEPQAVKTVGLKLKVSERNYIFLRIARPHDELYGPTILPPSCPECGRPRGGNKWCALEDDFRTSLADFVAALPQIDFLAGLSL